MKTESNDIGRPPRGPAPRRGLRLAAAATAAVLVVALAYLAYDRFVTQPALDRAAILGFGVDRTDVAAPAIELEALDGTRFSLAQAKGQVVFVNFWATWCPPCREEMPSMVRLGRELEAKHPGRFRMVAVSVDEAWDPVKEFFAAPPYFGKPGLAVALDPAQVATRAYYCAARGGVCPDLKFPETYIVDKDGRLVAFVVGPRDWSDPSARLLLESMIGS
ncbi:MULTISPECIES: TlpA disulfide reductase family protein [Anaeromyxobacter]|uniref:TlpA family protein disulfide reductase n=1 Tax=Anaeromyxobacter TaxID=161492 RepID=UPI001F581349|nr:MULTISPECIES: TlpA disulfide reductase family protein [unclassified Anaeromyxobacter]